MLRAAVFLGAILSASPALAGWQWTEWGMTVDEVLKIAPKEVEASPTGDGETVYAYIEAAGFPFSAQLNFFGSGRLNEVVLFPVEKQCPEIISAMVLTYGEGGYRGRNRIGYDVITWSDFRSGNRVELRTNVCSIMYSPLNTPNENGGL